VGVVLDTSTLIAAEHDAQGFARSLEALGAQPVAIAAITVSELLHGWHRARDPAVRARRGAFVDAVLDAIHVLPFGLPEARRHAELWADLTRRGKVIGPHDLLIGATALTHGFALATLNWREFERVPGLAVKRWARGA
jgi:tRNA(fMet)-specific endonuclease VapC